MTGSIIYEKYYGFIVYAFFFYNTHHCSTGALRWKIGFKLKNNGEESKETSQMLWGKKKKNLTWTSFRITWKAGKWVRVVEIKQDWSWVYLSWSWLMDTWDSLFSSLYFCICLNFSIISFSKIPGFNYFPARVYILNMETRMFVCACILQSLYFINISYIHKILISTSFLQ